MVTDVWEPTPAMILAGNRDSGSSPQPLLGQWSDGTPDRFDWSWAACENHNRPTDSPLALFVPRIITQDEDNAPAANDLALVAYPFDAGTNFHQTRDTFASHLAAMVNHTNLELRSLGV